jgi:hypothetical protein
LGSCTGFAGRQKVRSLSFFVHLTVEKVCKAIWVSANQSNVPPKTHNLIFIISQTPVELNEAQKVFLLELNRFQIEGRYPEDIVQLNRICTPEFTSNKISEAKTLITWLQNKLP